MSDQKKPKPTDAVPAMMLPGESFLLGESFLPGGRFRDKKGLDRLIKILERLNRSGVFYFPVERVR